MAGHEHQPALFAGRFRIEKLVARGGMGSIYRALDELTGEYVALKKLTEQSTDLRRFEREATLLAELAHPSIVRHVAHGRAETGEPFLAMEWLEGPNLRVFLENRPLSVARTVELGMRLAEGLEYLHDRGILHRDIKPENLIVVGGETSMVKLIDLGVARQSLGGMTLTQTGVMVGTVGYMAPEQAQGAKNVDRRADLFAMGCALYQCLTGTAPFAAASPVAFIAKLLLDEVTPVDTLRSDVPAGLAELIHRLLARNPNDRPASAREVIQALRRLEGLPSAVPDSPPQPMAPLRSDELRLTTVAIVGAPVEGDANHGEAESMRSCVPEGGEMTLLAGGALVISFPRRGGPAERAAMAARFALDALEVAPKRVIVLATGRAVSAAREAIGLALDRGGEILSSTSATGGRGIVVDELTAGLLRSRFVLEPDSSVWRLRGETTTITAPVVRRLIAGQQVPCVGRRKELTLLDATLHEAAEEEIAQAVLVVGPAGIGKSRLAVELDERLAAKKNGDDALRTRRLVACATPTTLDAAGSMLRTLVRSAAGIAESADREEAWFALESYLQDHQIEEPEQAAEMLGELIGVPSPHAPSRALLAAREDPKVLRYWLTRIVPRWLRSEARDHLLLLVLEDIQWADGATIGLLDAALREATKARIFVLALARPESRDRFDPLFHSIPVQTIRLRGLSNRAAEEMIHTALPNVDPQSLELIRKRAGGNPFFLEELIRAVAAGQLELPDSVLGVVEENIERSDPEARRALRAASVFGPSFRVAGVAHLLGDTSGNRTRASLEQLVVDEILQRRHSERPGDSPEYAFRHILLRDAAYAMLPEAERPAAHRLAASWLEEQNDVEPGLLAEHWELSGDHEKAAICLGDAARAALARSDVLATLRLAERGLALEPSDEVRGRLLTTRHECLTWTAQFEDVKTITREVITLLPPRSNTWVTAVANLAFAGAMTSDLMAFGEAVTLLGDPSDLEDGPICAEALQTIATALVQALGEAAAKTHLEALLAMDARIGDEDPIVRGWARFANAIAATARGDNATCYHDLRQARACFIEVGEPMGVAASSAVLSLISAVVGSLDEARALGREIRELGRGGGIDFLTPFADLAEAAIVSRHDPRASLAALKQVIEHAPLDSRALARVMAAIIALRVGDLDVVRSTAEALQLDTLAMVRNASEVFLGYLALEDGRLEDAKSSLARSEPDDGETLLLTLARDRLGILVHRAGGDEALVEEAIHTARARLDTLSEALPEALRATYSSDAFDVQETLELIANGTLRD